ncbi:hypothetical protein VULLAG_LOCUS11125 [Vulpes lagopus]
MEILCIQLHRVVDDFCDQNRDQPEGQEQEQLALMELERDCKTAGAGAGLQLPPAPPQDSINEALINTVDLHYQSNSEESRSLHWQASVSQNLTKIEKVVEVICSVLQEVLQDFYYGVTQVFRSTMQA